MTVYPSVRYAVVKGELKSEIIHGPDQERPGWESTPHRFRPLAIAELIQMGHAPEQAAEIHQRELRRVAFIFAGRSPAEAEHLALVETLLPPQSPAPADESPALRAEISSLQVQLAEAQKALENKQAEMDTMVLRFNDNWAKLIAERDSLRAKLAKGKGKARDEAAHE